MKKFLNVPLNSYVPSATMHPLLATQCLCPNIHLHWMVIFFPYIECKLFKLTIPPLKRAPSLHQASYAYSRKLLLKTPRKGETIRKRKCFWSIVAPHQLGSRRADVLPKPTFALLINLILFLLCDSATTVLFALYSSVVML